MLLRQILLTADVNKTWDMFLTHSPAYHKLADNYILPIPVRQMYEILGSYSHPDKISIVLVNEVACNRIYVWSVPEKLVVTISREESPYLHYYEDGGSNLFRHFGTCIPKYMASCPRPLESACETSLKTSKTIVRGSHNLLRYATWRSEHGCPCHQITFHQVRVSSALCSLKNYNSS